MIEEYPDEDLVFEAEHGSYPRYTIRVRPNHKYFDSLALSIARAARNMSKLKEFFFDMASSACESFTDLRTVRIRSHAFSFHPGGGGLPTRVDWVFPCYHGQLIDWSPPAEASNLWRKKGGRDLIENMLALKDHESYEPTSWQIWRGGQEIGTSSSLEDQFQGYEFEHDELLTVLSKSP